MKTKIVKFEGYKYSVPVAAKFMARDESGFVWAYVSRPVFTGRFWRPSSKLTLWSKITGCEQSWSIGRIKNPSKSLITFS